MPVISDAEKVLSYVNNLDNMCGDSEQEFSSNSAELEKLELPVAPNGTNEFKLTKLNGVYALASHHVRIDSPVKEVSLPKRFYSKHLVCENALVHGAGPMSLLTARRLSFRNCVVDNLPLETSSHEWNIETSMIDLPTYLSADTVFIKNCPGLTLPGHFKIKNLSILSCLDLERFPEGMGATTMDTLYLNNCPSLKTIMPGLTVNRLIITGCSSLTVLPEDLVADQIILDSSSIDSIPQMTYGTLLDISNSNATILEGRVLIVKFFISNNKIVVFPSKVGISDGHLDLSYLDNIPDATLPNKITINGRLTLTPAVKQRLDNNGAVIKCKTLCIKDYHWDSLLDELNEDFF